jgi:predicted nucleic acid-binding protein
MRFLVDTNIIINFLTNRETDTSFLKKLLNDDQLFISPIVIAEYLAKCPSDEEIYLKNFIELGTVIPIDREISFLAGTYRRQFSNKTKKTYLADCFLAATCKVHNLTLVTNNVKDYPMKDIKIIKPS